MSFKDHVTKERRTGTYSACKYEPITCGHLARWARSMSVPNCLMPSKYHSTIIYSRNPIKDAKQYNIQDPGWRFTVTGHETFTSDGKIGYRLLIDAPELIDLHHKLIADGGTHSFTDFLPHVTVSYDIRDFDISSLDLHLPTFPLVVSKVYCEPLNFDWK